MPPILIRLEHLQASIAALALTREQAAASLIADGYVASWNDAAAIIRCEVAAFGAACDTTFARIATISVAAELDRAMLSGDRDDRAPSPAEEVRTWVRRAFALHAMFQQGQLALDEAAVQFVREGGPLGVGDALRVFRHVASKYRQMFFDSERVHEILVNARSNPRRTQPILSASDPVSALEDMERVHTAFHAGILAEVDAHQRLGTLFPDASQLDRAYALHCDIRRVRDDLLKTFEHRTANAVLRAELQLVSAQRDDQRTVFGVSFRTRVYELFYEMRDGAISAPAAAAVLVDEGYSPSSDQAQHLVARLVSVYNDDVMVPGKIFDTCRAVILRNLGSAFER
ncbi:MAG: hypothetical protein ACOYN3_06975 [Acidimicrobiia bacterium]